MASIGQMLVTQAQLDTPARVLVYLILIPLMVFFLKMNQLIGWFSGFCRAPAAPGPHMEELNLQFANYARKEINPDHWRRLLCGFRRILAELAALLGLLVGFSVIVPAFKPLVTIRVVAYPQLALRPTFCGCLAPMRSFRC